MAFDPDAYLAEGGGVKETPFDPDSYLGIEKSTMDKAGDFLQSTAMDLEDAIGVIGRIPEALATGIPAQYQKLVSGTAMPKKSEAIEADLAFQAQTKKELEDRKASGELGVMGGALREALPSLSASAVPLAAAIPAGIAGTAAAGPLGGAAGAGLASGAVSYRMQGADYLYRSFKQLEENKGSPLTDEERAKAYKELLPLAQDSALWEAGPEAVGNAVSLGVGKFVFGFGKQAATQLAKESAQAVEKTLARKIAEKSAAVVGGSATEVGTETITAIGQYAPEMAAKQYAETGTTKGAPTEYPGGIMQAAKDVAPATLATQALFMGAGGAVKLAGLPFEAKPKTPVQIATDNIDLRANKEATNLAIDPTDEAGKGLSETINSIQSNLVNKKEVYSVLEATDPAAQTLKLEIQEDENRLILMQAELNKRAGVEITEAEKAKVEEAKKTAAPEITPAPTEVTPTEVAVAEAATPVAEPVEQVVTPPVEVAATIAEAAPVEPITPAVEQATTIESLVPPAALENIKQNPDLYEAVRKDAVSGYLVPAYISNSVSARNLPKGFSQSLIAKVKKQVGDNPSISAIEDAIETQVEKTAYSKEKKKADEVKLESALQRTGETYELDTAIQDYKNKQIELELAQKSILTTPALRQTERVGAKNNLEKSKQKLIVISAKPAPIAETPPVTEASAAEVAPTTTTRPAQEDVKASRYRKFLGESAPQAISEAKNALASFNRSNYGKLGDNPFQAEPRLRELKNVISSFVGNRLSVTNQKADEIAEQIILGKPNIVDKVTELKPIKAKELDDIGAIRSSITRFGYEQDDKKTYRHPREGEAIAPTPAVSETITQPTTTKVGTDVMVEATPTPLEDRYTFEEIFNEAYKLFGETIPEKFSIMTDENQKFKAAYTLEDGAIEVNLAYMNKGDDIRTTIIHELGHYIYGDKDFRKYFDQFLASFNAKERAEIETYVESVYNKQTGELRLEEKQVRAFVERFVRDENASQWQGMLDAIKRFLNKLGFNFKFSNKDALAVFSAALDRYKSGQEIVRKGKTGKIAGQTKMMMAAEQAPIEPEAETITEAMAQGLDIGKEDNMPINNKIESHIKNFAVVRGFFESASDRLRRAGFKKLATAIDDYYDQAQRRLGFANKILLPAFDEYAKQSKANKKKIDEEVKMFYAAQENKRDTAEFFDELNPITQKIVTAWQKFGEESGKDNQRIGIKVFDRGLQRYRPIGRIQKFFPRILKPEYKRALMEPDKYQKEYNEIVDALIKSGRIEKPEEAERYISNYEGTGTQQDYFSGIESARGQALPEELYDYSMQVMTDYVARWSQHASRIEQFGQKLGENSMTLWDRSRASTRDRRTIDYITAAQERVEGYFPNDPFQKGMAALNIWASGLQLGNPASATMNMIGGTTLNAMIGQPGAASSYVESLIELRKLGSNLKDAREKGIISRDLMNIVGDHQQVLDQNGIAKVGQKTADFLLKWSGFTPVEQMIRTQSLIIGKSFLRKTLSSFAQNPDSSFSKQASTWLSRNNFDIDKLLVEQGSGPETDKLMRYFATASQGGYTISQTPIFIDTPTGKFLFKYQKFSTQVMRQAWKNTFEPAWKAVTFKGETMQLPSETRQLLYRLRLAEAKEIGDNRKISLDEIPQKVSKAEAKALTLIPVMMWLASAYVGGEAILRLRDVLFGVMMKGPDYEDILKALEDDEDDDELYLGLQRAWYNLIGIGALGLIGNYGQFFMDWQDRERVKNPLDPPALSLLKETGTLITNVADQGTLTKGDINNYLNRMSSMYRVSQKLYQTSASGLGFSDAPTVAEEMYRREVADINKYARRWAESAGLEYRTKRPMDIAPSKMTPINREISGYLQRNDPVTAAAYAKEYLKTLPKEDRKNAIQSMESGARNRQPLRLGSGPMDEAEKKAFLKWAKTKMSPEKYAGIEKLSKQYETNRKKFLNRLPNR